MEQKGSLSRPDNLKQVDPMTLPGQLCERGPQVMGILNVTPDSFSDGGRFAEPDAACEQGLRMVSDGAAIIDIGGESTRPGATPVSPDEEIRRVIPVIERIRSQSDVCLSIDTYHSATAEAALVAGANIINDVSALRFDPDMAPLIARTGAPLVLMHMLGTPKDMQTEPHYDNCVEEIASFFEERIRFCMRHGIKREKLIIDPGLGFGKRLRDNLEILAGLERFRHFGLPILVGASRKSFISALHPSDYPADKRLGGSLAAGMMAINNGADILRVHDVAPTVEALKVIRGIAGVN